MQRGASSVYFPKVYSAIDIPPDSNWAVVDAAVTKLLQHSDFLSLIERPDHPLRDQLIDLIAVDTKLTRSEVLPELQAQIGDTAAARPEGTLDDIKPEEWIALCHPKGETDHRDYFIARKAKRPEEAQSGSAALRELNRLLDDVTLVERLREVRVLRGFERHTMNEEVPSNLASRVDFLPAVEVFGEGYFLRFAESAIAAWEARPDVYRHCVKLIERARGANVSWLPEATPRLIMLHTLAHVLLRNTAFEAGYSTSSLHERLYVTPTSGEPAMSGVLIYTAAGDNQGTLGGLVRMGEYDRLSRLLFSAVAAAQWCSFDPVCGESPGQGPGGLSLAACHACCLVPETSCDLGNRLLDRRLLVDENIGFFATLAAALDDVPGGGTW
jgi:hypothetical protein